MLGLRFCVRAFSSCSKWGSLFIAVRGPLTIAAPLVAEHRLQMRRLSSCGLQAQPLRGMWDLPRPGLEPVSPALAGGFSTTAPPGKPLSGFFPPIISLAMPKGSARVALTLRPRQSLGTAPPSSLKARELYTACLKTVSSGTKMFWKKNRN